MQFLFNRFPTVSLCRCGNIYCTDWLIIFLTFFVCFYYKNLWFISWFIKKLKNLDLSWSIHLYFKKNEVKSINKTNKYVYDSVYSKEKNLYTLK